MAKPRGWFGGGTLNPEQALDRVRGLLRRPTAPDPAPGRMLPHLRRPADPSTEAPPRWLTKAGARAYNAALFTRQNSDWSDSRFDANREIYQALGVLRSGSREAERNNGLYRRMLTMHVNYIAGRGYELQSIPMQLGADPRAPKGKKRLELQKDEIASDIIEARWRQWAKGRVTLDGRYTLRQLLKMLVRSWVRDGEIFVRKVVRDGQLYLQPLEADMVPETMEERSGQRGYRTICGINVDDNFRPVSYNVYRRHPGEMQSIYGSRTVDSFDTIEVPASEILHLYTPERANQVRGVPMGCAAFPDLRMLAGYFSAELAAARFASSRPVSIERDLAAETAYTGDGDATDPDTDLEIDVSESGVWIMPPGLKMNAAPANHPSGSFDAYTTAVTRHLAAAWGVSHAFLTRNLSEVNLSSLRVESADCQQYYTDWRDDLVETILTPVFAGTGPTGGVSWLEVELLSGRLSSAQIKLAYTREEKYRNHRFIAPPFPVVDPEKELEGDERKLRLNITTYDELTRKYGGQELDDVLRIRAAEREKINSFGLVDILDQAEKPKAGQTPNDSTPAAPPEADDE